MVVPLILNLIALCLQLFQTFFPNLCGIESAYKASAEPTEVIWSYIKIEIPGIIHLVLQ